MSSDRDGQTPNERTRNRRERKRRAKAAKAKWPPRVRKNFRTPAERRAHKFGKQGGVCHWFVEAKRGGAPSRCPDPDGRMTLELSANGNPPPNYASFEHLHRRRDGGTGKPWNVVLACLTCNVGREKDVPGVGLPKPENVAAKLVPDTVLIAKAKEGTLNGPERGQLFTRGLVPNWPMWSKLVASAPPGAF